jgi:biotin transporter BioY
VGRAALGWARPSILVTDIKFNVRSGTGPVSSVTATEFGLLVAFLAAPVVMGSLLLQSAILRWRGSSWRSVLVRATTNALIALPLTALIWQWLPGSIPESAFMLGNVLLLPALVAECVLVPVIAFVKTPRVQ